MREHYEVQANTYYRQIKLQDEQLANLMEKSLALCTVKPQSENAGNNIITPNCLSVNDQTHQSRPTLSTPHCSNSADLPSSNYYLSQGNMDPLSNFFPSKLECKVDGKQFLYSSLEQAFQHRKAKLLREQRTAFEIMQTRGASRVNSVGHSLNQHPNIGDWTKVEEKVMKEL